MYRIILYLSRNTSKVLPRQVRTIAEARSIAKDLCRDELFSTEDFHGNPIRKSKVAIESGEYPNVKFELWEYISKHDRAPIKTEWRD